MFLNVCWSGVFTAQFSCYMAGALWNCCRLGACSVYTIQPCATVYSVTSCKATLIGCMCLAVTCTFGRMTVSFLCATAVTWGWFRDWNKSQHKKVALPTPHDALWQGKACAWTVLSSCFNSCLQRWGHWWDLWPHLFLCDITYIHTMVVLDKITWWSNILMSWDILKQEPYIVPFFFSSSF